MAKLIYTGITSLDGYTADPIGRFDWAAPSDAVHGFVNELIRPVATYLYGRKMYETMQAWETFDIAEARDVSADFARLWRDADKVVFSSTLDHAVTARTRIVSAFDVAEVRRLKSDADRDLAIGGPILAAHAIRAGLVDEFHRVIVPAVVGGGTPYLPDDVRIGLELRDERRFDDGAVYLRYAVAS